MSPPLVCSPLHSYLGVAQPQVCHPHHSAWDDAAVVSTFPRLDDNSQSSRAGKQGHTCPHPSAGSEMIQLSPGSILDPLGPLMSYWTSFTQFPFCLDSTRLPFLHTTSKDLPLGIMFYSAKGPDKPKTVFTQISPETNLVEGGFGDVTPGLPFPPVNNKKQFQMQIKKSL